MRGGEKQKKPKKFPSLKRGKKKKSVCGTGLGLKPTKKNKTREFFFNKKKGGDGGKKKKKKGEKFVKGNFLEKKKKFLKKSGGKHPPNPLGGEKLNPNRKGPGGGGPARTWV